MYSPISLPSPLVTRRRLPPTPVDGSPHPTHRRLCEVRSAVPFEMSSPLLAAPMRQPLRSQSFKHRPKPLVEVKRSALEDVCVERRRSTPTVSRRCSLQRGRPMERTDVWPEARVASEAEERFLKLPDADDYTRVRQISIDKKGAVVSRGDSFRRKKTTKFAIDKSPSPYITSGSDSARGSRSGSPSSSDDGLMRDFGSVESGVPAGTSHNSYKIYVIGNTGTGKSSLIAQLITSEYRNAFADEIQNYESTVSICIGGQECDLIFFEHDLSDPTWLQSDIQSFVVVYSIDSRVSWKQALNAVEMARNNPRTMHIPILMAGNKIDLERKRTVTKNEVRAAAAQYGFEQFEISVALNHDVDELLVGLVAEIQEAFSPRQDMITPTPARVEDDFHAAIRRYSMRKKKEVPAELAPGKCSALSPAGLFNKLKNWRRGSVPRIQT